jgi:hypothetical protein
VEHLSGGGVPDPDEAMGSAAGKKGAARAEHDVSHPTGVAVEDLEAPPAMSAPEPHGAVVAGARQSRAVGTEGHDLNPVRVPAEPA